MIPDVGQAVVGGTELSIARPAFAVSRRTVLGTLIHELAHIGGAPGGQSKLGEEAVLAAGMGRARETGAKDDASTPFDPNIGG